AMSFAVTLILSCFRASEPFSNSAIFLFPRSGLFLIASRIKSDFGPSGFAMCGSPFAASLPAGRAAPNRELQKSWRGEANDSDYVDDARAPAASVQTEPRD